MLLFIIYYNFRTIEYRCDFVAITWVRYLTLTAFMGGDLTRSPRQPHVKETGRQLRWWKLAFYPYLNRLYSSVSSPTNRGLWEIPNWQYAAGRPPLAMSLLPIDSPLRWLSTTMSPAVHGRTSCGHSCAAALVLATVVSQRIDYHWSRLPLLLGSSPAPPRSFFGHHPSRPISPTQSFNRWCRTTFVTVVTESTD